MILLYATYQPVIILCKMIILSGKDKDPQMIDYMHSIASWPDVK